MKEPWQPIKGETSRSYAAFIFYRDSGPGRNIEDLRVQFDEQFNCVSNVAGLRKWSRKFKWDDRCLAWEARLAEKKASTELRTQERSAIRRAADRERRIDANLHVADLLRDKVHEMLRTPTTRVIEDSKTTNEDGTITYHSVVMEPAKWQLRDIAVLAKTACELECVDLLNEGNKAQFDPSEETIEEAQRKLAQFRQEQLKSLESIELNPPGTSVNPIEVPVRESV